MRPIRLLLWSVWLAAAAATGVHLLRPNGLVVRSPSSAAVIETAVACAAALLAALFYGRWRQRGLLLDLATCLALAVLAIGKVVFTVIPITAGDVASLHIRAAALLTGAAAAALLGAAAWAPARPSHLHRRVEFPVLICLVGGVLGGLAVAGSATATSFAAGLTGPPTTDAAGDSSVVSVTLVQLVSALGFGLASMGFARRERLDADPFYGWLAATVALWALARVNYAWTPAALANDMTVGDWLRIAGYSIGVVAASYEFTGYWRRLAQVAVLEERRRLARDMHDGLGQELAFVATQARMLGKRTGDEGADVLARAAERALDESRRGIAALTRPLDEPLDVALAQQAEELSGRLGVRVLLDLHPVAATTSDTREALLRIAREAITNAARHGRPSKVVVHLSNHDGVTLRIADDGRGFLVDDPRVFAGGRYGVAGMRERAEALGGSLQLQSRPYGGTKVEVWVP